ncbi:hypothetical protein PanWU01x14_093420 [Parasponia andersonii]|uniref:Uncharacterized protein n=1 Tax=Parasponia andersonii TaxID=3476 RepID=A0A2P5D618_PARAD|nr:hypothetical protein PanWU01x14_093420 [Parasponia andersonii]
MSSRFLFNYKFLLLKDALKDQLLEHMSFFYKKPKLVIVFVTTIRFVGNIFALFARCICPRGKATGAGEGAKVIKDVNLDTTELFKCKIKALKGKFLKVEDLFLI